MTDCMSKTVFICHNWSILKSIISNVYAYSLYDILSQLFLK